MNPTSQTRFTTLFLEKSIHLPLANYSFIRPLPMWGVKCQQTDASVFVYEGVSVYVQGILQVIR